MRYDPRKHGARCDACPRKGTPVVPPEGQPGCRVVWLGQDPGQQEVRNGRPFIGPTGTRLTHMWERACDEVGLIIPRHEIWVTNAALCMPITDSPKEARAAMDCCRPRLMRELQQLAPGAGILAMGKWACYSLWGKEKGVGDLCGFHVNVDLEALQHMQEAQKPGPVLSRQEPARRVHGVVPAVQKQKDQRIPATKQIKPTKVRSGVARKDKEALQREQAGVGKESSSKPSEGQRTSNVVPRGKVR